MNITSVADLSGVDLDENHPLPIGVFTIVI